MLIETAPGTQVKSEVIDFSIQQCGGCGIVFFIPAKWLKARVENHGTYHCPNGCDRQFTGKSKAEKLEEQLQQERDKNQKDREALQNKWLDEMGRANKAEKLLKRVHKGVCPCCNRSFQNLNRHMKTKHPELLSK